MRSRLLLLPLGLCFFSTLALWAQSSASQPDDPNTSRTDTTQSQSSNINPARTVETHTHSGNRTVDTRLTERRGSNGDFESYQDVETETVKVNATTVHTVTRTYGRNSDGAKTLVQVSEEEKHTSPGGDSRLVRSTSNPDANGNLQVVQRQIEETKKIGKDVEQTQTTVELPGGNGELAPAMQTQERRQRGGNGTIDSQKTTLLPDGNGSWQVGQVEHATIRQDGKTRTTDDRISRSDFDGNLDEVSRTVSHETERAPGESQKTEETYSADVPGTPRDGGLHPVERKTTIQRTGSTGKQTTVEQVEKANPGDAGSDLQVTTVVIDTAQPGSSGSRGTRTIQTLGAGDSLGVVSVDTTDSHSSATVQVQIAPSEKPK